MTSHAIQPAAMRTGLKTHYIGTLSKIVIYMEITRAWGVPLSNIIAWMVLYCEHQLFGVKKKAKPFLHLSLGKAGPFTVESHICVKTLKCKAFQIIRCLIN